MFFHKANDSTIGIQNHSQGLGKKINSQFFIRLINSSFSINSLIKILLDLEAFVFKNDS
jgi:hypothetical protein